MGTACFNETQVARGGVGVQRQIHLADIAPISPVLDLLSDLNRILWKVILIVHAALDW